MAPENIHTHPMEGHYKFLGRGGLKTDQIRFKAEELNPLIGCLDAPSPPRFQSLSASRSELGGKKKGTGTQVTLPGAITRCRAKSVLNKLPLLKITAKAIERVIF